MVSSPWTWRLVFLLFLAVAPVVVMSTISGFYGDNGQDQTVIQHRLDLSDISYVQHSLLSILEMSDRPPLRGVRFLSRRSSAARFLLDMYKRLKHDPNAVVLPRRSWRLADNDPTSPEQPMANMETEAFQTSDRIVTFVNKRHHVAEVYNERGTFLWFDVSQVYDIELMLGELRIFQDNKLSKWKKDVRTYAISVYAITDQFGEHLNQPLAVVKTTSDYRGWLAINITTAIDNWLNASTSNHGLYIDAHSVHQPDYKVKLSDVGLVKAYGAPEYQPFMVGYFHRTNPVKQINHRRVRRESLNRRRTMPSEIYRNLLDPVLPEPMKNCQLGSLFVSFRDLHWKDWILAPDGYSASYCAGVCNFPLHHGMNATNHAIVQMLVHLTNPGLVPKPLCAPSKMSSIVVVHVDEDTNVNLKTFLEMTVESCGCH